MSEWRELELGEVITLKRGYDLPNSKREAGNVPIYSSSGIKDFHSTAMKHAPGVITGRYGTIGLVFYAAQPYWPLNTTLYVSDFKSNDPKFIYYLLKTLDFEKYNDKSAVPGVNRNEVHKEPILLPSVDIQRKIASILSSLDDKIDLLQRQNKTLEAMAEALFREWFVEGPEREAYELDQLVEFDPRERVPKGQAYKVFDMKCLSNTDMTIDAGVERIINSGTSFRNGDTLLAKITPCLENGKTGFVMNLTDGEVARGSTEFVVMRSKGLVSPYWIYCLARSQEFREAAIQSMTGTSGRQRVQVDLLRKSEVYVNEEKMLKFANKVTPYFEKVKENSFQIQTLTNLRDTLLPRLMSGEISLNI